MMQIKSFSTPFAPYREALPEDVENFQGILGINQNNFFHLSQNPTETESQEILLTDEKLQHLVNTFFYGKKINKEQLFDRAASLIGGYQRWLRDTEWSILGKRHCFKAKLVLKEPGKWALRLIKKTQKVVNERFVSIRGGTKYGQPTLQGRAKRLKKGGAVWPLVQLCPNLKDEDFIDFLFRRVIYVGQYLAPSSRQFCNYFHVDGWENGKAFSAGKLDNCDKTKGIIRRPLRVDWRIVKGAAKPSEEELVGHVKGLHGQQVPWIHFNAKEYVKLSKEKELRNLFADWDYEAVNFKQSEFRKEWLHYQSLFKDQDIYYGILKAFRSILPFADFGNQAKKRILRYTLYALQDRPFKNSFGQVKHLSCATFQAYLYTIIEHKLRLRTLLKEGKLSEESIPTYPERYFELLKEKETASTADLKRITKEITTIEKDFADQAKKWATNLVESGKYDKLFQDLIFRFDPEYMTPGSLYSYLYNNKSVGW